MKTALSLEQIELYDLSKCVLRGRMSESAIDTWHEKHSFLDCEDKTKDPNVITTYCMRTVHIWIKVTNLMYEHWVYK